MDANFNSSLKANYFITLNQFPMSIAYEEEYHWSGRGLRPPRETSLCANHIGDYAIKDFIAQKGMVGVCEYCKNNNHPVIALEDLIEFIYTNLIYFYDDPGDNMYFESALGGYHGASTFEPEDILDVALPYDDMDEDLRFDIIAAFDPTRQWCEQDPYGDKEDDEYMYSWQAFKKEVKSKGSQPGQLAVKMKSSSSRNVFQILEQIGALVNKHNIFTTLTVGTTYFRCRQHKPTDDVTKPEHVVSPPIQFATYPNRMSPTGTAMFYCAFDILTARNETIQTSSNNPLCSIAEFTGKSAFHVLDLTNLPDLPSMFDEPKRADYFPIAFLKNFVVDFTGEVERNGREHIEYIPTQLVTEYFKDVYESIYHQRTDGILYPSCKNSGHAACVLFLDHKESLKAMQMVQINTTVI